MSIKDESSEARCNRWVEQFRRLKDLSQDDLSAALAALTVEQLEEFPQALEFVTYRKEALGCGWVPDPFEWQILDARTSDRLQYHAYRALVERIKAGREQPKET